MRITEKILRDAGCCKDGIDRYFKDINRKAWDAEKLIDECIKQDRFQDASYSISRMMNKMQRVKWAVYCAEQVIKIFEDKYPDDDRPRKAIEAAKAYLKTPNKDNRRAAAAYAAAYAAYADAAAAADAAYADAAAADAAYAAADAAYTAAYAYADAAAAYAARANYSKKFKAKLLKRGLKIYLSYQGVKT